MKDKQIWKILKILAAMLIGVIWVSSEHPAVTPTGEAPRVEPTKTISDTVRKGDTLYKIFTRHDIGINEVMPIRNASLNVHPIRTLQPGQPYRLEVGEEGKIDSFRYLIDDDSLLEIRRGDEGFFARREPILYRKGVLVLEGTIEDNLVSSMGDDREHFSLAMELSDIYAWDIDFNTDLRKGDSYRIVVEGLYLNGELRKFGKILSAEFRNDGRIYKAYRYTSKGREGYYDEQGRSLEKMFLKAPLSFRRISSYYTSSRFHPVLKIRRPHRGLDYAAAKGTPVSSVGEGVVLFAGWRGQFGRLVVINHSNRWKTYYGHLSRIVVRRGAKVDQGQIIAYVGSTGLATGPHLHYEVKHRGQNVDPLSITASSGGTIPQQTYTAFHDFRSRMDRKLASGHPVMASLPVSETNRL